MAKQSAIEQDGVIVEALFCKKNNLVYGYKNSWCRFTSK